MLRAGVFKNEKTAEEQVVQVLNFDVHLTKDFRGKRYIERITECTPVISKNEYTYDHRKEKTLEGKFDNGKLNGYGRLIDLFGVICYEGTFKDNQLMDGKGKIIKIGDGGDKTIYEGDIKNMKKEGKGIEKNKFYTYLGSFNDDLKHGKGKIMYEEGDSYEGDFLNDKLTGYGKYKWENNNTYEGEFLDGNMHGKGLYKWADGNEYEGQYINNIKEGAGEFRWKNGKKYKGPFQNNKPHGIGLMTKANGETIEVEYENGKIVKKTENIKKPQKSYTLQNNE